MYCSDSPYATDPWNLSVLPRQGGQHSSLLRVLDGNITGGWASAWVPGRVAEWVLLLLLLLLLLPLPPPPPLLLLQ